MKKHLGKVSILLIVIFTITTCFSLVMAEDANTTITILQTTDLHGRIYAHDYATDASDKDAGLAKIQTLVLQERAKNPDAILMDTGDTVQDNSADLFNSLPVHPMVQALNYMKYDIWTIGNHEFNFEKSFLDKNIAAFEGTVLSANTYKEGTDERYLDAYKIFEIDGVRVAVVGMLPPNITLWEASAPEHFEGLAFTGIIAETEKVIKELEGKYDVLVGNYHLGPDGDHAFKGLDAVAEAFPQFDVLFGGHAHSKINKEVNGVTLVEPGKYGWALGKADITVAKVGDKYEVTSVIAENIETSGVEEDPGILEMFKFVHDESLADANTIVGTISTDFIAEPDFITGEDKITTMPTSQIMDSSIIDLINEVQMFYADADVSSAALFNFGSNLKAGDFKKKDVAYIYKYTNTLNGVNISGENLLKYMEWSAGYYNTAQKGDLTVSFNPNVRGYNYDMFSGLEYEIDITQEKDNRVKNVMFKGQPLEMDKIYKLAVNNYRMGTLIGLELVTLDDEYYNSYELFQDAGRIRDLIVKYTIEEKKGNLTPTVDNNWEITNFNFDNPLAEKAFALVRDGTVTIPTSEDGRTANVEALNIYNLIETKDLMVETYKVKAGDVLWKIAKSKGMDWKQLAAMNALDNPNLIFPSQELMLP